MTTPAEFILRTLSNSASGLGNGRIKALLHSAGHVLTDSEYLSIRSKLLGQGLISLGRGRGGSIRRVPRNVGESLKASSENQAATHTHSSGNANDLSVMKISIERNTTKLCDAGKTSKGQFNTTGKSWLYQHVLEFMTQKTWSTILDPFAGAGDLLNSCKALFPDADFLGYDIDPRLASTWKINDSLLGIPKHPSHPAFDCNQPAVSCKTFRKAEGCFGQSREILQGS